MPYINKAEFLKPNGLSIWLNGGAGSGKTLQGMTFPKVMIVTFDPTGTDVLRQPENQKYIDNLVIHVPLNGIPLNEVFQFTETPSEQSIYGALALARKLGPMGERRIETVFLDGFNYLATLKWTQICESKGVVWTEKQTMDRREADQRGWYDALGSYLDHLVLQNLLPLATRDRLNVIVSSHVQRESKNTIEGIQGTSTKTTELANASKRQVNLDSDLSPQVLGSFRQRIAGLPSAMIYLEDRLEQDKDGKEVVQYYAYCRRTRSESLDTVILAKNRFGLGTLRLTNGNLYKTILAKITNNSPTSSVTDSPAGSLTNNPTTTNNAAQSQAESTPPITPTTKTKGA
jgi:hypothetical protein